MPIPGTVSLESLNLCGKGPGTHIMVPGQDGEGPARHGEGPRPHTMVPGRDGEHLDT